MVLLAAGAWGLAIAAVGLTANLWAALALLASTGAADMISGLFRMAIRNQTVPDHLRGRLAGIEMLMSGSVVSGGLLCVAGTVALAALSPQFVRYDGRTGADANSTRTTSAGTGGRHCPRRPLMRTGPAAT